MVEEFNVLAVSNEEKNWRDPDHLVRGQFIEER